MATLVSGGKTIRIDQHEPTAAGAHPAILLLHGSGGNVAFWSERMAPYLTRLNIAFYAVHYFDRTGTVRADVETIRDGVHFPAWLATASDALAYIRTRPAVDANRIALIGISLGAFLALALGTERHPKPGVRAIVEISGGLAEPYAAKATAAFPPTLILHGDSDTVVPATLAQQLDAHLTKLGVPHETHMLAGQGHWFDGPSQMQILAAMAAFLGRHL